MQLSAIHKHTENSTQQYSFVQSCTLISPNILRITKLICPKLDKDCIYTISSPTMSIYLTTLGRVWPCSAHLHYTRECVCGRAPWRGVGVRGQCCRDDFNWLILLSDPTRSVSHGGEAKMWTVKRSCAVWTSCTQYPQLFRPLTQFKFSVACFSTPNTMLCIFVLLLDKS